MKSILMGTIIVAGSAVEAPLPDLALTWKRPDFTDKPGTARWVVNQASWGVIATTSVRLNGTAFGNPISIAEINGQPYFYVSRLDESMKDIAKNPECTLSLSEASLDCRALNLDPEDPRCSRLSLTGKMVNVLDEKEHDQAKQALFNIHSAMKSWPSDHNWLVTKLNIEKIWLIDFFGGAADISPKDYYDVDEQPRGTPVDPSHEAKHWQPFFVFKAETARWLMHEVTWGTMVTTSIHLNGTAFGNPVSLVDGTEDNATGTPYFLVSALDTSIKDLQKCPKFSLTISQAQVNCALKGHDPEDPRCTRITYTGTFQHVTDREETEFAKRALLAKHPVMAEWMNMSSHAFFISKMKIEEIWLLDFFGGASYITPDAYYKASGSVRGNVGEVTV